MVPWYVLRALLAGFDEDAPSITKYDYLPTPVPIG